MHLTHCILSILFALALPIGSAPLPTGAEVALSKRQVVDPNSIMNSFTGKPFFTPGTFDYAKAALAGQPQPAAGSVPQDASSMQSGGATTVVTPINGGERVDSTCNTPGCPAVANAASNNGKPGKE